MTASILAIVASLAAIPGYWVAWRQRRRTRDYERLKIQNKRLRIQLRRLKQAAKIDEEIDNLTNAELHKRLQKSPYRRD